ncbi:MAG: PAS domain S-box protein [Planctomycetota bacterium]
MSSWMHDDSLRETSRAEVIKSQPGSTCLVQSPGIVLVALDTPDLPLVMASSHANAFLRDQGTEILSRPLNDFLVLDDEARSTILAVVDSAMRDSSEERFWLPEEVLRLQTRETAQWLTGIVVRWEEWLVFELFRERTPLLTPTPRLGHRESATWVAALSRIKDPLPFVTRALSLLRAALGCETVLFLSPLMNGKVSILAEAAKDRAASRVGAEFSLGADDCDRAGESWELARYFSDVEGDGVPLRSVVEGSPLHPKKLPVLLRMPSPSERTFWSCLGAKGVVTEAVHGAEEVLGTIACLFDRPVEYSEDHRTRCRFMADLFSLRSIGEGQRLVPRFPRIRGRLHEKERSWRVNESAIRGMMQHAADGVLVSNAQGEILACNSAVERIFGHAETELVGQNVCKLMPSPYHDEHNGFIERYLRTGDPRIIGKGREVVGLRRDGRTFALELSICEITIEGEKLFTAFLRDVTEGKQAREALGKSEERLSLLLEGSDDAFWEWDVVSGELFVSHRWHKMMGRFVKESLPVPPRDAEWVHPEDRPLVHAVIDDHLSGKTPYYEVEHRVRHADGHWFWVRDRGRVTARDGDGKPLRVAGILTDITARKVAEQAVGSSETRFRTLIESAECVILIASPDGELLYASPFAEVLTGYSADDITTRNSLSIFVTTELLLEAVRCGTSIEESTPPRNRELPLICKDGRIRWLSWNLRYLPEYHGKVAVLCIGHEITELKAAQKSLLRAERLSAIGEVFTGLAHESRNVLQRSQACIELLAHRVKDRPDALSLIDRLQKAQDHLHHLYEEVRSYAAPLKLAIQDTDLASLLIDTWDELAVERELRDATLKVEEGVPPPIFPVDPFRMAQVLRNILENALSASPDPLVVEISFRQVTLEGLPALAISISDNGPGFTAESMTRVFDPFYTTKTKGTGLGMAIAKRIIEAHGGKISAQNRATGGAEFSIVLKHRVK